MPKIESLKHTRFFRICMAHPYAVAFGCGFLVLGIATGVSTCAILKHDNLLADCMERAGQSAVLFHGFFRIALFNLMLCCGVLSGTLFASFVPFSCACLTLQGFAIGFVMKQLQIEYAWWGVVYGLAGIILPSFCMLTGLIFCFGQGVSQLRGLQKTSKGWEREGLPSLEACVRLTAFLTAMGILLEGVAAQVLLRLIIA